MIGEEIDRKLAAGIRWSFLGLAFFLPLLLSTRSSEVFELPKMLFVYGMTAVIVGLWLMRMLARREVLIRRTPLDIPILLFLISQMASTIYSIDPTVSWWGWYGRFHGGLWSTISYTLLYYALVSNIQIRNPNIEIRNKSQISNDKNPKRLVSNIGISNFEFVSNFGFRVSNFIAVILFSAAIVGIYAILQHFGIDKNFWVQDVVNRVFSTQGQPNWLAAYLVMAIPLTFAMIINSSLRGVKIATLRPSDGLARNDGKINMISYFLFMIFFLALLWTKSRSGLIGLAVADAIFWSVILFKRFNSSSRVRSKATNRPARQSLALQAPAGGEIQRSDKNISIADARSLDSAPSGSSARDDAFQFLLIHLLLTILILATNNPAREYIFQKSRLISAKISSNQMADKSDKSASGMSDLSIVRFLADFSRDSDFSGIGLRKSEQGGTESGDIRRIVWNGAVQLVKQRPVFGFGPETFGETYWRVRPKEHNLTSEWNFLYNKAHNEWLNLAANTGIFGLGSHLLLLIWFSVWAMRSFANFSRDEKFAKLNYLAAILAGLIGVEAVNFFGFSTVTIGTYRYLFMAVAISAAGDTNKLLKPIADRAVTSVIQNRDREENLRKNMDLRQKFILAGLSALILYLISQVPIFFLADLAYNRGRAYQDGGYIEEAVEPLMRAVNLVPGEPVFRAELAEAEGSLAALLPARLTDNSEQRTENPDIQRPGLPPEGLALSETIARLKNDSIANFEIVRRQSPENLGFIRTEAKMLFLLGNCAPAVRSLSSEASGLAPESVATAGFGRTNEFLQGKNSGPSEDDAKICNQALQLMKLAAKMAPTNPQLPYSLGQMLSKMGKEEEAAVYYNKAVELKPDYPAIPISE